MKEPKKTIDKPEDSREQNDNPPKEKEIGGRKGPEPNRYGDWENNGIISDF